jgi:hypothetical protein
MCNHANGPGRARLERRPWTLSAGIGGNRLQGPGIVTLVRPSGVRYRLQARRESETAPARRDKPDTTLRRRNLGVGSRLGAGNRQ